MRLFQALAGLMLLCCSALPTRANPPPDKILDQRHRFDIHVQPLSGALRQLSAQTGVRILFPYEEVSAIRSRRIDGWMTTGQALQKLLAGTHLRMTQTSAGVIALAAPSRATARQSPLSFQLSQAASPPPPVTDPTPIIVTGTRLVTRTVADSMTPIDIVSARDLEANGRQSVRDLLGALIPAINVSNSGAGASFAIKTLSLRGLAGDHLLVLVNGKRRHNSATLFINGTTQNGQSPPDLDLIPSNMIERIEVLRDGASAHYGSDAIAGVVNILLKSDSRGGASVMGGGTADGGGEQGRFQVDKGFAIGPGTIHLAADGVLQGRTIRGGPITSSLYFPGDPREATADRMRNKPGQPQVSGLNLAYQAVMPLGASELYTHGTWSRRRADAYLTYRPPNSILSIPDIYPEGYIPHLFIQDRDSQVTGGLRGDGPAGFRYDLSTSYARNQGRYSEQSLNVSLGPTSPTRFFLGAVTATEWTSNVDVQRDVQLGLAAPLLLAIGAEYRENGYRIVAGDPTSYADGGYRSPAGAPFAGATRTPGAQGVTGFTRDSAGQYRRHNWSAYLNLEQKIANGFEIALAARHEDYSDFGATNIWKVSTRIEPAPGLALRGTVSTGFRAPTLQQRHYASSSTIGVLFPGETTTRLAPVRALRVNDPVAIAWGAQPLKPERSTNLSAGLVLAPVPRISLAIDAYQIRIRDRILLSGTLSALPDATRARGYNALGELLLAAGLDPVQSGFYFSNAASTRTRGVDMVATWRADMGTLGQALLTLSGNINRTIFTRLDVPPVLAGIGVDLIDRARQGDITKGTPRSKIIANLNWTRGDAILNLRATRYGSMTQVAARTVTVDGVTYYPDDRITPKLIFDVEYSHRLAAGVRLAAGANNLFNIYPTKLSAINQGTSGFALYNSYAPYGISGGYYYGKLSLAF
ncbi:TonB-dependent receptor plug domain-containing protein [Sphingobium lactosutens]|nr:TonB-dependent receptor [Sphingobium lactosutens]